MVGLGTGPCPGGLERMTPPAFRTSQKWKAARMAPRIGRIAMCRTKKMDRVLGPTSGPPRSAVSSVGPTSGTYSSIPVPMVTAQKASWSQGSR